MRATSNSFLFKCYIHLNMLNFDDRDPKSRKNIHYFSVTLAQLLPIPGCQAPQPLLIFYKLQLLRLTTGGIDFVSKKSCLKLVLMLMLKAKGIMGEGRYMHPLFLKWLRIKACHLACK